MRVFLTKVTYSSIFGSGLDVAIRTAATTPSQFAIKLSNRCFSAATQAQPSQRSRNVGDETVTGGQLDSRKWDIHVAVCVERKPVITNALTELERNYQEVLLQQEFEGSKKADHEIRHEKDAILVEKIKKGEIDQGNIQTAQDFEDACLRELQAFQPAPRTTEADHKKDVRSLERALQSHLLLTVHTKVGQQLKWVMPYTKLGDDETLRQAADRVLSTYCPELTARILGNAPWGFYKYNYPVKVRNSVESFGSKTFFYKAHVVSGQMSLPVVKKESAIENFGWFTRDELPAVVHSAYFKSLSKILIPEYTLKSMEPAGS